MNEKILLASYSVIIKFKREDAILNQFNTVDDFYVVLKNFLKYIHKNVNQLKDRSGKKTIFLTLDEPAIFNDSKRICYGYFSSGITGERYKVKEIATNTVLMDVDKNDHASYRDVFFYFKIPSGKTQGYLILQRKTQFGIKTKLVPALNGFLAKEGYTQNNLRLNNILHSSVYENMMLNGKLKKVELVRNKIPDNLEDFLNNDENYKTTKGTFKSSFSSGNSLPEKWKNIIHKLSLKEKNETVEIDGLDDNFTDLEFQLELNGKQKTFYIKNQHRVQPDIDVTNNIDFKDDVPTTESLIQNAEEIINDIIEIKPKNV